MIIYIVIATFPWHWENWFVADKRIVSRQNFQLAQTDIIAETFVNISRVTK